MVIKSIEDNARNEENGKVIRKAQLARQILREGGDRVRIIDIKGDKLDEDKKRSVFVFRDDDAFQEVFAKVLDENRAFRESRSNKANEDLRNELDEMKRKFDELKKMTEAINATTEAAKE